MEPEEHLWRSWRAAADDLAITVEQRGDAVLVPQFGSSLGMLCSISEDWTALKSEAEQLRMGFSVLGESYLSYDRSLFIDTLNDWGWCNEGAPPLWYTGEAWTA